MPRKIASIFLFLLFFYGTPSSSLIIDKSLCNSIINNISSEPFTPEELVRGCEGYSTNGEYITRDTRTPSFNLRQSIFSNRMLFDQLRDPAGSYKIFQKFKNHVDASGRNRYHPAFTKTDKKQSIPKRRGDDLMVFNKRKDPNDRFQRSDKTDPEGFSYDFVRFGKRNPLYYNKKSQPYDDLIGAFNQVLHFERGGEQDKRSDLEGTNYDFVRFG
uniref:Uncharacterized protein n=1 Tax=Strongyloides stercoralis TaxID=6248 RepID=A0AAF5DHM9_STRER